MMHAHETPEQARAAKLAHENYQLGEENNRLLAENRKLRAFKTYVHQRLDEAGIETHPNGPHSAEGCRIGDRLDIVLVATNSLKPPGNPGQ